MKKCFLFLLVMISISDVYGQPDSIQAPYKRFPSFPPVKLLKPDSATYFTKQDLLKKSPVMLMIFNPQCEHCQQETEAIIKHMDEFKKVQIVMAALAPFDSMLVFFKKYKLEQFENIAVGKDIQTFLPAFYMLRNLPFFAFYNRKKELISVFEGALSIPQMLETISK